MKFWNVIYNWADAGYVLSEGTFTRLMEKFPNDESCEKGGQHWKNSDWYLGKHLAQMNIRPVDTVSSQLFVYMFVYIFGLHFVCLQISA